MIRKTPALASVFFFPSSFHYNGGRFPTQLVTKTVNFV